MRALVTGGRGFVGGYLCRELEQNGYEVINVSRRPGEGIVQADLMETEQLTELLRQLSPGMVFHLSAQADVAKSWRRPQETVQSNVTAAVSLMEAVRAAIPDTHVVLVGSSDQYGDLGRAGANVNETVETRPRTPYAVSKKAQEEMARVYVQAYGLHICMTRSFNHGGAGQREGFLISDFASGIVRVEKGLAQSLRVGNLTARRDFTHVKDVVRAYRLIAEQGQPGEIYNVGSGTAYSAQEILDRLCAMASCPVPVEQDPAKMRPSDTPVVCCDHSKLTARTGWEPEHTLDEILRETLAYYRATL